MTKSNFYLSEPLLKQFRETLIAYFVWNIKLGCSWNLLHGLHHAHQHLFDSLQSLGWMTHLPHCKHIFNKIPRNAPLHKLSIFLENCEIRGLNWVIGKRSVKFLQILTKSAYYKGISTSVALFLSPFFRAFRFQ